MLLGAYKLGRLKANSDLAQQKSLIFPVYLEFCRFKPQAKQTVQNNTLKISKTGLSCIGNTWVLVLVFGNAHDDYKSILFFAQTYILKYLPIHENSPLTIMASSMPGAQREGTHITSGVRGDSGIPINSYLILFIMFPFCDAILIELKLKISKDISHYICHQFR